MHQSVSSAESYSSGRVAAPWSAVLVVKKHPTVLVEKVLLVSSPHDGTLSFSARRRAGGASLRRWLQPGSGEARAAGCSGACITRTGTGTGTGRPSLRDERDVGRPDRDRRRVADGPRDGAARQTAARHQGEPGRHVLVRGAQRL